MNNVKKISISVLTFLFLGSILIFTIYPVIYALVGSFKTNMELVAGNSFFPKEWQFKNYIYAFEQAKFMTYTLNSVILCFMTTVLAIITSSLAGYCMARQKFPGKKILNGLYLSLMFISVGSVSLYPLYKMMNSIGLTNSLFGLALVLTGGQAANIFLVTGFVRSLPKELDEAAIMEGCSPIRFYASIIMPLIRPIIAVVGLFTFRSTWNNYITSMVFTMANKKIQPLIVAVVELRNSANAAAEWHIMLAGAAIAIIPILFVYILTNKQFISGLTAGSVKG